MPHAMGRKQGILVSVSERTVKGLEPVSTQDPVQGRSSGKGLQALEIDLRELSLAEAAHAPDVATFGDRGSGPDGTTWSRWFRRQLTGSMLILAADVAVLAGYMVL